MCLRSHEEEKEVKALTGEDLMSRGGTIQRDSCQELAFRSGSDSGLHGTSRRRDSSVPERSRLRLLNQELVLEDPDLLCLMAYQVVFHLLEQLGT